MMFAFDADILSTFAKINKLGILPKIFGSGALLIPPAVVADLQASKSESVRKACESNLFQHATLDQNESEFAEKISKEKRLGRGEIECIAVCKFRSVNIVTNDSRAISYAEKLNIGVIDLETILYSLKDTISNDELNQLINEIESEDKVVIVNKGNILS